MLLLNSTKLVCTNYTKFEGENGVKRTAAEHVEIYLEELVNKYPIITIEDGIGEHDWDGWKKLSTERSRLQSSISW